MTTLRQIITDAFRESTIISAGESPEADEHAEALRRLQVFIKSLLGNELGDNFTSVSYGTFGVDTSNGRWADSSSVIDRSYIPDNSRVVFNNNVAKTLYLSPSPRDGARVSVIDNSGNFATYPITLDGNTRKIEGSATVTLNTNSLAREWFYRADLGEWVRVTDLTADSENPFPQEFDDLLILMLAIRLNPRYAAETRPETVQSASRIIRQFRARYQQGKTVGVEEGLLRLAFGHRYRYNDEDDRFDEGIV